MIVLLFGDEMKVERNENALFINWEIISAINLRTREFWLQENRNMKFYRRKFFWWMEINIGILEKTFIPAFQIFKTLKREMITCI